MKKLVTISLLFLSAFSIKAQTVDEIVNKHIDAIGGKEALLKVQSMVREGTLATNGMEVGIKISQLQGKGFRNDISVMGMNGYQIATPIAGWSMMPFGGSTDVKEMTEVEVKEGASNLDCQSSFLDYAAKGYTVELAGSEVVDGKDCFKLNVNRAGKISNVFIDKSTFLISKTVGKRTVRGNEEDFEMSYSNYKKVDGIMVAHTLVRPEGEMTIEKVTINSTIDESIFKPSK
jgi:hypothetical protein